VTRNGPKIGGCKWHPPNLGPKSEAPDLKKLGGGVEKCTPQKLGPFGVSCPCLGFWPPEVDWFPQEGDGWMGVPRLGKGSTAWRKWGWAMASLLPLGWGWAMAPQLPQRGGWAMVALHVGR